ncbi:hypothetical protein ACWEJ7_12580 [Streptomyces albidoflavus]
MPEAAGKVDSTHDYRYDYTDTGNLARAQLPKAGNRPSIKRTPGQGMPDGQAGPDTQCFVYDQLRRMTSAWTAADDTCTGGPSKATVGGDQPYWHSYTFDDSGNRTALTEHDPAGNTAKDIKRTYSYGGEAGGPNRLSEVASEGPGGTTRSVYGYDKAGNTTTRQHNGTTQTLKWDPEGALTEVSEPVEGGGTKTTKYLNDASGERLLRHGPDGSTTLYLGETELTAKPDGTTTRTATEHRRQPCPCPQATRRWPWTRPSCALRTTAHPVRKQERSSRQTATRSGRRSWTSGRTRTNCYQAIGSPRPPAHGSRSPESPSPPGTPRCTT